MDPVWAAGTVSWKPGARLLVRRGEDGSCREVDSHPDVCDRHRHRQPPHPTPAPPATPTHTDGNTVPATTTAPPHTATNRQHQHHASTTTSTSTSGSVTAALQGPVGSGARVACSQRDTCKEPGKPPYSELAPAAAAVLWRLSEISSPSSTIARWKHLSLQQQRSRPSSTQWRLRGSPPEEVTRLVTRAAR